MQYSIVIKNRRFQWIEHGISHEIIIDYSEYQFTIYPFNQTKTTL